MFGFVAPRGVGLRGCSDLVEQAQAPAQGGDVEQRGRGVRQTTDQAALGVSVQPGGPAEGVEGDRPQPAVVVA